MDAWLRGTRESRPMAWHGTARHGLWRGPTRLSSAHIVTRHGNQLADCNVRLPVLFPSTVLAGGWRLEAPVMHSPGLTESLGEAHQASWSLHRNSNNKSRVVSSVQSPVAIAFSGPGLRGPERPARSFTSILVESLQNRVATGFSKSNSMKLSGTADQSFQISSQNLRLFRRKEGCRQAK